jgi:sugar phosphate isomerase/epimerase
VNKSSEAIPRRRLLKDAAALATAGVLFPHVVARHVAGAETVKPPGIMGFSCIPLCFWREMHVEKTMSYEDWIRMAVELGLEGTEIFEPFIKGLDASGRARLAGVVHEAGLKVSMVTVESDFSNPNEREKAVAHVRRAVDAALVFGANRVRLTAASHTLVGPIRGAAKEPAMQSVAAGLRACLDYAEKKRVMLALENHPVLGTNIADFMKILERVDDERLKVNLDTANVPSHTTVEFAKLVVDRVVHVHVSELSNGRHGVVIGKGDVDIQGVFSVLKGAGYNGWISLEPLAGGKEDLRFSVGHVKDAWNAA